MGCQGGIGTAAPRPTVRHNVRGFAAMAREILESDWKAFRKLREVELERFCERVLGEIGSIASNGTASHHDRYLEIFRLIDQRDEELARAFNAPRRSQAVMQLATIYSLGLLSQDELLSFTPATREIVESFCQPPTKARGPKRA